MTEPLAWPEVAALLARALGEPVSGGLPLTQGWSSRTTWAAQGERAREGQPSPAEIAAIPAILDRLQREPGTSSTRAAEA